MSPRRHLVTVGRPVVVVVVAFAVAAIVFQLTGYGVADVFRGAWAGAVTGPGSFAATVRWSVPLILVSLGVLVSFRAGFYNVGGQGQMYVGAVAALAVALGASSWPVAVVLPLAIGSAMACGALWSVLPGLLRVAFGADEVVTTLMTNFIAMSVLGYFTAGPLKSSQGGGQAATTRSVAGGLRISDGSGDSPAILLLVLVAALSVWVLVTRTRFGLRATLAGRNPIMARWQGISISRVALVSFAISGALAGVAGSVELLGPSGNLAAGFSPDVGLLAVIVALVGGLSVPGTVLAAVLFGGLQAATLYLPVVSDLPTSALDLLNGLVALIVTVSRLPATNRYRRRRAEEVS